MVAAPTSPSYTASADAGPTDLPIRLSDIRQLPAEQRWTWVGYLRSRGALGEAARWLDAIDAIAGTSVRGQEERAALLMTAGRADEAVAILRQRAASRPSATASVRLALALIEAGDLSEAADVTREVVASSPELKSVQALQVELARATDDFPALRAHYEAEVALNPSSTAARIGLALAALGQDDLAEAGRQFQESLQLRADGEGLPLRLASAVASGLGQHDRAADLAAEFEARSAQSRAQRDRAVVTGILDKLRRPAPATIAPPPEEPLPAEWPGDRPSLSPSVSIGRPAGGSGSSLPSSITAEDDPDLETAPAEAPHDLPEQHPEVYGLLRRAFGYEDLRPGQAAVIANVLGHKDTIAIMPTGAGKSLTFQIPAMLLPGVTLVLSPLIALMKDQVESLPAEIRKRTVLVNSTLSYDEQRQALDGIVAGDYKLVYAAPERLRQWSFVHAMQRAGTSLVVIDEAHCISMWGHDFRPDYLQIPQVLPSLGAPPVLAITATATRRGSVEIGQALGRTLDLMTVNLFRPNLFLTAYECANREEKMRRTLDVCTKERGAGIVYVGSRKDTEQIATSLRQRGVSAVPYHAGLDPDTRANNQDAFMSGRVRVVVATVAFGMGVNKADVRFIVHLAPSRSLEAYAQESGRAGRDGDPARCVLLYSAFDATNLSRQSSRDQITIPVLRRIYLNLRALATGHWAIVDPRDLLPAGSLDTDNNEIDSDIDPRVGLGVLAQAGLIRRHPDAPIAFTLQPRAGFDPETTPPGGSAWREHVRWAWDGARVAGGSLDTLIACNALGITPTVLTETLDSEPELGVREGTRLVCLELLPTDAHVKERMADVLQRSQAEAIRRVAQMMEYAGGDRCRHQMIAAHLGQKLPRCGTVCDVCTGTAETRSPERPAGKRVWTTASDAMEVLEAARSLPFPMGKTGLTRLLNGSVESRVRDDRSASFGALSDVSSSRVGGIIDQLIEGGFLFRDTDHEYKLISVTARGGSASVRDLVAAGFPDPAERSAGSASRGSARRR